VNRIIREFKKYRNENWITQTFRC